MTRSTRVEPAQALREAERLRSLHDHRGAIDVLTSANRGRHDAAIEQLLVELRREAAAAVEAPSSHGRTPVAPLASDGTLEEVAADQLSTEAVRRGLARSGCLLVRGLVPPDRTARLVAGIDAAFDAFDRANEGGEPVDGGWYSPCTIPDRTTAAESARATKDALAEHVVVNGMPQRARRRFMRASGGIVTVEVPRMLFELFELVDDLGIGALMTDFLGERPMLSANKCTLRRVEPTAISGGWHQDGAFLGDDIGAFNLWLALSDCGRDAPGLDLIPARMDRLIPSDEESQFDWSLSERAVREAAGDLSIVRPIFRAGDAMIFDHRLVHRTAAGSEMTRPRYAIETWFFTPSGYPEGQLPLLY